MYDLWYITFRICHARCDELLALSLKRSAFAYERFNVTPSFVPIVEVEHDGGEARVCALVRINLDLQDTLNTIYTEAQISVPLTRFLRTI